MEVIPHDEKLVTDVAKSGYIVGIGPVYGGQSDAQLSTGPATIERIPKLLHEADEVGVLTAWKPLKINIDAFGISQGDEGNRAINTPQAGEGVVEKVSENGSAKESGTQLYFGTIRMGCGNEIRGTPGIDNGGIAITACGRVYLVGEKHDGREEIPLIAGISRAGPVGVIAHDLFLKLTGGRLPKGSRWPGRIAIQAIPLPF